MFEDKFKIIFLKNEFHIIAGIAGLIVNLSFVFDEAEIAGLAKQLKPKKWYMHFWNGDTVIAVFPNRIFRFKHSDKSTWHEAIEHGKSLDIPEEQLDFTVD